MNADEGEAAGLFAVKKDSDFTDLLLRAVTDTRDTDGLADLVGGFGNKLGRRAELTAERDFTAGSVDLLNRIVEAAGARTHAREVHTAAERRTRTLARRLSARAAEERGRGAELAQQVTSAAHAVAEAEDARGRSALVAAELAYRHASLALAAAEKGAASQRRELTDARTLHSAWQAAEAVLRHRAAGDRSARVAAAIREAERDAAPRPRGPRHGRRRPRTALAAAAEEGERHAAEEEERSTALQEAGETAHRDATAAATEAQRARSEAGHLRQRLTEVEQETAEAVRAGWLDDTAPDADPARAALAASDAEKTAVAAWDTARETAAAAIERARGPPPPRPAPNSPPPAPPTRPLPPERPRRGAPRRRGPRRRGAPRRTPGPALGRAPRRGRRHGPRRPAHRHRPRPVRRRAALPARRGRRLRRAAALRTAHRRCRRLPHPRRLGDGGLLPPGPDVLATVEHLGEHGIPALPAGATSPRPWTPPTTRACSPPAPNSSTAS